MVSEAINSILCCPACESAELEESDGAYACTKCKWQSTLIGNDTPSFASVVYEEARGQTRRVSESGRLVKKFVGWLKEVRKRIVPWRWWIFRDVDYWRTAIQPLRDSEFNTAETLLSQTLTSQGQTMLELGVGFQDHRALYEKFAHCAICSDIYRDPVAAQLYSNSPNVLYGVINVDELPIRDNSIDVLFTSHVVEHFPDRENNLRALHQKLRPGAIACHVVPTATCFVLGHLVGTAANFGTLTPKIGRGIHGEYDSIWEELRLTTVPAWKEVFERCGFELMSDAPGTLGLMPMRPTHTLWLAEHLHIYGSWVFVMRVRK